MPTQPSGKEPHYKALKSTRGTAKTEALRNRPADAEEVARWFDLHPDANLGVLCGEPSNLAVLDFDGGSLPVNLLRHAVVETGRGAHVYVSANDSVLEELRQGQNKPEGLDVVKTNGHVVAPPSLHHSGSRYRWVTTPEAAELKTLTTQAIETLLNLKETPREDRVIHRSNTPVYQGLAQWDSDPGFVEAFCSYLGVPGDRKFCCVLPGHEETRPSAALYRAPSGAWLYNDFHRQGKAYPLVQVFASVRSQEPITKVRGWGAPSLARWKLRLLAELGYLTPEPKALPPLPYGVPDTVLDVYDGVNELFGLRWAHEGEREPVPLTRDFLSSWCATSPASVERAKGFLISEGIIVKTDDLANRARLWLPGEGKRRTG